MQHRVTNIRVFGSLARGEATKDCVDVLSDGVHFLPHQQKILKETVFVFLMKKPSNTLDMIYNMLAAIDRIGQHIKSVTSHAAIEDGVIFNLIIISIDIETCG